MLTPLVTLETAGRRPLIHRSHSAPAGSVRVELQHATGAPLAGFTAADCPEIIGDEIERVVRGIGHELAIRRLGPISHEG